MRETFNVCFFNLARTEEANSPVVRGLWMWQRTAGASGADNRQPQQTISKKKGLQSYNHKEKNSANNHMSSEETSKPHMRP